MKNNKTIITLIVVAFIFVTLLAIVGMYNKDESKHNNKSSSTTTVTKTIEEQIDVKKLIEKVKMINYLSSKELLEQTKTLTDSSYKAFKKASNNYGNIMQEIILKKDNTFFGYYAEQTTTAIEGYYIKKDNKISLYAYKMYGSDALCTILEKPVEYTFTINNDSLEGTFKDDFGTMKFEKTSFDNLDGINTYIKNIEETVYERE